MAALPDYSIQRLSASDVPLMKALLSVFADAFNEPETYEGATPGAAYLEGLLAKQHFIALTATKRDGAVIGGLAAYELTKFEQERSEIYIYDLAVAKAYRRSGVATALIDELRRIGAARGAYVIFVQADRYDDPAIALYTKLGVREEVLHFDINVDHPASG
jgi:aminoglycoside 3-N-acetyltransferase I